MQCNDHCLQFTELSNVNTREPWRLHDKFMFYKILMSCVIRLHGVIVKGSISIVCKQRYTFSLTVHLARRNARTSKENDMLHL